MIYPSAVLAHQGGWDEVLLFAIPVVIALGAVKLVEMRSRRTADDGDETDDDGSRDR